MTLLPDIQADMAYAALNTNNGFYTNIYQWDIKSTTDEIIAVYNGLYTIVARCNFFLDYKDQVEVNLKTTADKIISKSVWARYILHVPWLMQN